MDWVLCALFLLILIDSIVENIRLSIAINRMKKHGGGWTKETFYGGKQ